MAAIRPARPEEIPWLLARSLETAWEQIDAEARAGCDRTVLTAWIRSQMQGALRAPGSATFLAEGAGGEPAGYIIVAVMPHPLKGTPVGFLLDIWVTPAARGQGVADALCQAGEAHCRALGLKEVVRIIAAHNHVSLHHALRSGCRITQHLLSKPL